MKNLTPEELIHQINDQGYGYGVIIYEGEVLCLDDPKLEFLWNKCYQALNELQTHIMEKYED